MSGHTPPKPNVAPADREAVDGGAPRDHLTVFFRRGNLIALRELALRRIADRADAQMEVYGRDHAISAPWPAGPGLRAAIRAPSSWQSYAVTPVVVALCTAVTQLMDWQGISETNLVMVYLLGVVGVALRGGSGPASLAAVLSVAVFNFFFVAPRYTLAIHDSGYLITFSVMLVVGLVIGTLTARFQQQAAAARERERRTAALYELSRAFASTRGLDNLLRAAVVHIHTVFDSAVAILLPDDEGRLRPRGGHGDWAAEAGPGQPFGPDDAERAVAQWVFEHRELAGAGTNTLPRAAGLYLPLNGSRRTVGVLGVRAPEPGRPLHPEQAHLLETFASQTALAIERAQLAEEAQRATVAVEAERLRSALLSSVSHDLRTPLAIITGALSSLAQGGDSLDPAARDDLAQTACDEALRLNRLLGNLLEMTRLEAGAVRLRTEWQPLEEVVGVAVARVAGDESQPGMLPGGRRLSITLPPDLPLVPLDGILIEQVLVNLLENAIQHTPPGTPVALRARPVGAAVEVAVADRGPGLPPGAERDVFEKFYRGGADSGRGNVGLGLAICKGMVEAHGGQIWAESGPRGGAVFRFTLPIVGTAPTVPDEALQGAPAGEG